MIIQIDKVMELLCTHNNNITYACFFKSDCVVCMFSLVVSGFLLWLLEVTTKMLRIWLVVIIVVQTEHYWKHDWIFFLTYGNIAGQTDESTPDQEIAWTVGKTVSNQKWDSVGHWIITSQLFILFFHITSC